MWSYVKRITAMVLKLGWTLEPPEEFLNLLMPRSNLKSIKTNSGNEIQASVLLPGDSNVQICLRNTGKERVQEISRWREWGKSRQSKLVVLKLLVCIRITWKQAHFFHVAHWRTEGAGPLQVPPIPQVILIHTKVGEPWFQVARNNTKGETKNYEPPQAVTESVPTPLHLMNTT